MSNLTTSTALELISAHTGDSITVLRARLTIEGYAPKTINAAIEEAKATGEIENKARSAGFTNLFYNFLIDGERTEEDVIDYIEEFGSSNTMKHKTHYIGVWQLTNAIRG